MKCKIDSLSYTYIIKLTTASTRESIHAKTSTTSCVARTLTRSLPFIVTLLFQKPRPFKIGQKKFHSCQTVQLFGPLQHKVCFMWWQAIIPEHSGVHSTLGEIAQENGYRIHKLLTMPKETVTPDEQQLRDFYISKFLMVVSLYILAHV